MRNLTKKRVLLGLMLLVLLGGLFFFIRELQQRQDPRSRAAGEAVTFTFTPTTQNVIIGGNANIDVALQAQTNNTTGVDITLSFDPTRIEAASFQPAAHGFSTVLNNGIVSTAAGTIRFTAVNINPTTMPSVIQLGKVVLKTKTLGTGNLSISKSQVTSAGIDTALPVNPTTPATFTVNPVPTNTPTPTPTNTPTPTPTRTPTPTPTRTPTPTPTNTPTPTPTRTPTPIPPTNTPTPTHTPTLTPTRVPLVGDYTGDFVLDLLDFNLWKDEYLDVLSTKKSDGNNDGVIDLVDYALWRNRFITQ